MIFPSDSAKRQISQFLAALLIQFLHQGHQNKQNLSSSKGVSSQLLRIKKPITLI